MKNLLKKYRYFIIIALLLLVLYFVPNIVYAATSSKINFCQYPGTRRTFKIIGLAINIAKVIAPLILIITGIIALSKTIISGKDEDFRASLTLLVRKAIAGIAIFLLPGIIDFAFDYLVGYDDSSFTACTKCMLSPNSCQIPDEDPETYTE